MDPVKIASNMARGILAGYPFFHHFIKNNLRTRFQRGPNPETITDDLAYTVQVADHYLDHLAAHQTSIRGKRVLELGPGKNLGTPLLLACHGAEVVAVEPKADPWDQGYHPRFYSALLDWLVQNRSSLDLAPLERVVREERISGGAVELIRGTLLKSAVIGPDSVDVVFSNAVLEHVFDLRATLAKLARITSPGGLGFHQIDFQFHSFGPDPLRFLLFPEKKYRKLREYTAGECGSRLRFSQYKDFFLEAGFDIVGQEVNLGADPAYLEKFRKRLSRRKNSPYRGWPAQDLAVLSARIEVARPG